VFLGSGVNGIQGKVLGMSTWNKRRPYLTFEWATLLVNSPRAVFSGQMFGSKEGPVGFGLVSNQKPYLSEPAAWFPLKMLSGWVIQKLAGV
jgi:hypothetical protein